MHCHGVSSGVGALSDSVLQLDVLGSNSLFDSGKALFGLDYNQERDEQRDFDIGVIIYFVGIY